MINRLLPHDFAQESHTDIDTHIHTLKAEHLHDMSKSSVSVQALQKEQY